jgi:hypothetical protein
MFLSFTYRYCKVHLLIYLFCICGRKCGRSLSRRPSVSYCIRIYHVSLYRGPMLIGDSVTPTTYVRTSAMLLLLTAGNLNIRNCSLHSILQSLMQLYSSVFTLVQHVSATLCHHQVLLLLLLKLCQKERNNSKITMRQL